MQNLNTVSLEGFLTEDPKFRAVRDNVEYAAFRIATNHDYRNQDGDIVKRPFFHNIVVKVSSTVEAIKTALAKGSRVVIQGRLESRTYTKEGGGTAHIYEVVVNPYIGHVGFLDKVERGASSSSDETDDDA